VVKRRGATLVETLVVLFVFSILTTVIVVFYGFANRASARHEALSENYRKMLVVLDRVQTLLEGGQVLYADLNQVVFIPLNVTQPVKPGGWPNYGEQAVTLACRLNKKTQLHELVIIEPPKMKETLFTELPHETIGFSKSQNILNIQLQGEIQATQDVGQTRYYSFTRSVFLDQF
jgi:type II secretory pathway pseudopilin PulG